MCACVRACVYVCVRACVDGRMGGARARACVRVCAFVCVCGQVEEAALSALRVMLKKSELFFFRNEEREGAGEEGKAFIRARSTSCFYVCVCMCVHVCVCVQVYVRGGRASAPSV